MCTLSIKYGQLSAHFALVSERDILFLLLSHEQNERCTFPGDRRTEAMHFDQGHNVVELTHQRTFSPHFFPKIWGFSEELPPKNRRALQVYFQTV